MCTMSAAPPPSPFVEDMRLLLERGDGDITIRFSDGETQAHSVMLGARSAVIHAMLQAPMQEAQTRTMEMQCCRETGLAFLHFLYTGELGTTWPSSTHAVCEMGWLIDFYGVKGIDFAFGQHQSQSFVSKVEAEYPIQSETFWVDIVGFLQSPGLPDFMRQVLIKTVIKPNLVWGRDVFLASCIADAAGAEDIKEKCMEALRMYFSTASMLTPKQPPSHSPFSGASHSPFSGAPASQGGLFGAAPTQSSLFGAVPVTQGAVPVTQGGLFSAPATQYTVFGPPNLAVQDTPPNPPRISPVTADEDESKATGFSTEFAEARIAECIMRSSPMAVLSNFINIQAEINRVMKYRTGAVVPMPPKGRQETQLKFNTFQSEVHAGLADVSSTIIHLAQASDAEAKDKGAVPNPVCQCEQ